MDDSEHIASKPDMGRAQVVTSDFAQTICCPYHGHLEKATETFLFEHLRRCGWTEEQLMALDRRYNDAESQSCILFGEEESHEERDYKLQRKLQDALQQRLLIARAMGATQPHNDDCTDEPGLQQGEP
ncbi:hypothetical protein PV08_06913 [Exophiala spinifera]|uniref:Uncharacterized protein n=1 Tax=Exophiala spinifera TaxID=91928 RepID=A0A0D1ZMT3_9EURO|nr:uncharacterized protein PV08_06913 [Exophiala spinifera]KIW14132.1 hypothetical protein PV08_06913 [Exophiala spinifera]